MGVFLFNVMIDSTIYYQACQKRRLQNGSVSFQRHDRLNDQLPKWSKNKAPKWECFFSTTWSTHRCITKLVKKEGSKMGVFLFNIMIDSTISYQNCQKTRLQNGSVSFQQHDRLIDLLLNLSKKRLQNGSVSFQRHDRLNDLLPSLSKKKAPKWECFFSTSWSSQRSVTTIVKKEGSKMGVFLFNNMIDSSIY